MISGTLFVLFVIIGDKVKRAQISAEAEKGDSAICTHRIAKAPPNAMKVKIGEYVTHRWSCAEEYGPNRYSLFVRNCDQIERNGQRTLLTDKFGCTPRNASNAAVRLSLNYSLSSAQHNANESVLLTVSGYSLLRSFPFEGFFRIECTLSLLPKVPNETEFPNCSQNLLDRENSLNNLLTPSMAHQKRFIDMVEMNVSSDWIEVENERKNEKTVAQNSGEKEKENGTKQRRQFGVWHDQMPISGESEEVPAMALSPFLERAYSIFATSLLSSTPPSTFASFSTFPKTTEIHSFDFAQMSMSTTPSSPAAAEPSSTVSTVVSIHPTTVSNPTIHPTTVSNPTIHPTTVSNPTIHPTTVSNPTIHPTTVSNPTAATSAAIINPTTVFNIDKSIVSEATTNSIHTMESQTPSPFLPSIGLLRAETPFPFEKHLPTEEATTKKSTGNEAKRADNSFGGGNALTAKMEEVIRGFVPLFVGQNSTNSSNSNSTLFHNLSTRQCSWTMLNTALLVWSIFSTLHWLCLLAAKLRSSVVVRRRLKISPKQKIAVAKMSAMKRKMMGPKKHCGGIKQRRNLIEYPNTSIISKRDSPAGKRRSQQKALRTVRQRHLLHRTMAGGGMAPMGAMPQGKTPQNEQKEKLPFSVVANSGGQKQKKAPGRRLVTKLGRICEEEEEEGKGENYRQKLVIGGRSSEEMTDGSEGKGKSGKLAEKTAFWDGWAHRERQIGQTADRGKGGQNWTTDRAEKIFKFF